MEELRPEIGDLNVVIYEKGNKYVALREIKWTPTSDPKIDIRNYVTNTDGDEVMMKGVSLTPEGAHSLTNELVRAGFGDTNLIESMISEREDYGVEKEEARMDFTSFVDIRKEMVG